MLHCALMTADFLKRCVNALGITYVKLMLASGVDYSLLNLAANGKRELKVVHLRKLVPALRRLIDKRIRELEKIREELG